MEGESVLRGVAEVALDGAGRRGGRRERSNELRAIVAGIGDVGGDGIAEGEDEDED